MATIALDIAKFRADFPAFSNVTTYPDATITMYYDSAILFISNDDYGRLATTARERAIYLFMAHLIQLNNNITDGTLPSLPSASTIGQESVTLTPPPLKKQFHWWLSLTAYGQQLFAMLQLKSVGGFFAGGSPESSGFRKAWGVF